MYEPKLPPKPPKPLQLRSTKSSPYDANGLPRLEKKS